MCRDQLAIDRLEGNWNGQARAPRDRHVVVRAGPFDPDALDRIDRLAQTGRIRQLDRPTPNDHLVRNDITASCPRSGRRSAPNPTSELNSRLLPTLGRPAITTSSRCREPQPDFGASQQRFGFRQASLRRARKSLSELCRARCAGRLVPGPAESQRSLPSGHASGRRVRHERSHRLRAVGRLRRIGDRCPGSMQGFDHQVDGRGPTMALDLDGRRVRAEHDGDHFVAKAVADPAEPQVSARGRRRVAHRDGAGRRHRQSRRHRGPQTCSTAMAPRPDESQAAHERPDRMRVAAASVALDVRRRRRLPSWCRIPGIAGGLRSRSEAVTPAFALIVLLIVLALGARLVT